MEAGFPLGFAVAVLTAPVVAAVIAAAGGEPGGGEGDFAEHLAGIFGAARGFAAFLGGDCVVQNGNHQLGIPFQTNDGELPQGDEEPAAVTAVHQIVIKHGANGGRDLQSIVLSAMVVANIPNLGAEDHGIQNLHHGGGNIGTVAADAVGFMQTGVAGEDVSRAVFAAEHRPFGKHGQTVQSGGAGRADGGIGKNPVVECDINAVVVPVKGYRLDGGLLRLENFRRRFHHFRHRHHLQS